jgi:pimeloyl-ACP methyl ester carboxylesterase
MRLHGPSIDRAVLYGVEGPDHTYDVPSEVLGSLEQIAEAAQRSPQLAGRIPSGGLLAALKTVEERLDHEPASATVTYDGKSRTVTLSRFDIQRIARNGIHDRSRLEWPALIIEMFNGDFRRAAQRVLEDRDWPIEGAMFFMMDCASGISAERLERIRNSPLEKQAGETLGDLNVVYSSCDVWRSPDLGVQFRSPLVSNVPVLLVQGTWDASTPFGNAVEVAAGLSHATLLRVEGGTHFALVDAFGSWPPMRSLLERFLRGRPTTVPSSIQLGEPVFVLPNGPG